MRRSSVRSAGRSLLGACTVTVAALVLFGGTTAGGSGSLGCSADLRDLYACDALRHAVCAKWKECGAIPDEDACYQLYLDEVTRVGSRLPSRETCLDNLDDRHRCLTDIRDLTCEDKVAKVDSCGTSVSINPADAGGQANPMDAGSPVPEPGLDGSVTPPIGARERLLTSETVGIQAIAADSSSVYWLNDDGELKQRSNSTGTTVTVQTGVSPPLEAGGGAVYFTRGSQYLRLVPSTGAMQALVNGVPQAVAVNAAGNIAVGRFASNILSFWPSAQTFQSGQLVLAGPGLTSAGRAFWAVQEGNVTAFYTRDASTDAGLAPVRLFASIAVPVAFFGAFYLDESGRIFEASASQGSAPTALASISGLQVAGTDGTDVVAVRSSNELVKIARSTGKVSTLLTASRGISVISAREGRPIVWASVGATPGIYTVQ